MKTKFSIFAIIFCSLLFLNIAEAKVKTGKSKINPKFEKIWKEFQSGVSQGNKEAVVKLVTFDYPGPSDINVDKIIKSNSEFIKNFDKIFTRDFIKVIQETNANSFSSGDEDGYKWYRYTGTNKVIIDFCDTGKGFKLVDCTNW